MEGGGWMAKEPSILTDQNHTGARAGARRARKAAGDNPRSGRTRRPPLHRILHRDHPLYVLTVSAKY